MKTNADTREVFHVSFVDAGDPLYKAGILPRPRDFGLRMRQFRKNALRSHGARNVGQEEPAVAKGKAG
jgi:hypothetical protein